MCFTAFTTEAGSGTVLSLLALVDYFLRRWMDFWLEQFVLAISILPAPTEENGLWKFFTQSVQVDLPQCLLGPKTIQAMPD